MHYVIGDVHGCYDELMTLLSKIDADDKDAIIYFVGDLVDRGPKVWETLEWAMNHVTVDGKYRSVKGNHEVMILEWYDKWRMWARWGGATKNPASEPRTEYDFIDVCKEKKLLQEESLEPIMDFFRSLPYSYLVTVEDAQMGEKCYRIAHAWHCYESNATRDFKVYSNLFDREGVSIPVGEVVVHGHTPTVTLSTYDKEYERPGQIDYEGSGINVDGGCCYHYIMPGLPVSMCGICLETGTEYYCSPEKREVSVLPAREDDDLL